MENKDPVLNALIAIKDANPEAFEQLCLGFSCYTRKKKPGPMFTAALTKVRTKIELNGEGKQITLPGFYLE